MTGPRVEDHGSLELSSPGKEKARGRLPRACKEEHQCSGTGSHTGHRYVSRITPLQLLQHRESTGVSMQAQKPGEFGVRSKSCMTGLQVEDNGSLELS